MVAMERTWLDVPFADKDPAKAAGARWDPAARRWYAPRPGVPGLGRWAALPDLLPGEDRSYGEGLFVDLIPQTSWFRNARAAVDPADWDRLRRMVYRRAGHRCEACGASGSQLEAHERFTYDTQPGLQRLVRLICLCTACHRVTHFGRTMLGGDAAGQAALDHLQAVTGMNDAETEQHICGAFDRWERRSEVSWRVDLSLITNAGIRLSQTPPEPVHPRPAVTGNSPDEADILVIITAVTAVVIPEPTAATGPGPATRALAATYQRYADELAVIEALRSQRPA
jgi:hypothetical protein